MFLIIKQNVSNKFVGIFLDLYYYLYQIKKYIVLDQYRTLGKFFNVRNALRSFL